MIVFVVIVKLVCIWDFLIYVSINRQFWMVFYNILLCDGFGKMLIKREEQKDKEVDVLDDEDEVGKKVEGIVVKKIIFVVLIDDEVGQIIQVENFFDFNSFQFG